MEKVERDIIDPIGEVNFGKSRDTFSAFLHRFITRMEQFFLVKGYLMLIIGFLLGRALILGTLTPFALPFFASLYIVRKDKAPLALIGLIGGAATLGITEAVTSFALSFFFLICYKMVSKWKKEQHFVPILVFALVLVGSLVEGYLKAGSLNLYGSMMALVEGSLGYILTLIFLQSIPLLIINKRRQALKTEEIVCIIIMLASVMTGTIGWAVYGLSLEHIMSRYLVLLFSFIAGATIGSTVGVVTGLIFSLASISSFYHMSLLAFSGLLGGLLKEGRKIGVAIGLYIATLLIGMYGEGGGVLSISLMETTIAVLMFLLTPKSLTSRIAKHIPGTSEYSQEQQQYMRKMRDVTAQRVSQFSNVFQALSNSFSAPNINQAFEEENKELDYFLSNVTEKTCQTCFRKEHCWARNFNTTYDYMKDIMTEMADTGGNISSSLQRDWDKHCTRSKKVTDAIHQELTLYQANQKLKKQVQESRKLVADQLLGVSEVMGDFAKEIQRERENHHKQEELILEAIQEFGIHIENVEIYSLEQGNVDIDITMPYSTSYGESEKLIAPMLSDILGETIIVNKEEASDYTKDYSHVTFRSAKAFMVETGVAHAAKDGGFISGDSYSTIELGLGKYAMAISDGMGNGERAHVESKETLQLLQKILQSGIEEQVAIKSINSILSLRTTDEIYSTLDLAMIDLQNAAVKFLKIGSTPSFIKRGSKIMKIQASNLPMGILQEFDVDVVSEQLKAGDLLIMMSDGVFEGPKHVENFDLWMKRKIHELKTDKPQEIADLIMEEVIRSRSGMIEDDMTVLVARIDHNIPKWTSIPVRGFNQVAN
ncbi:stage II sporulation protein E [Bacillus sp. B1-b2]|uniref:stage II sporulation protein E n=1 Tax=Bacillus sp. B1-b2 TaxID=2653201 RepID=UPI0012619566|nr:stage II sporulation protein E [Bacillus sp. B1-b2]KAB7664960.1 stage II sporulation protein E [Bacillus sp. B1-b2]